MRKLRLLCILACLLPLACQSGGTQADAAPDAREGALDRPNIIFVFTDDHASHAISSYGSALNQTPNIDSLASEGMLFRNCFVGNSICAPSRATILTGKHSHKNGIIDNGSRFDGSQTTFPQLLQGAGYETAMIGKWHLKSDPTGFNYWDVLIGQGPYYNPPMKSAAGTTKHIGYTTDIITDKALDWLDSGRDAEKPFMLMYQHKAPHRSWEPGPDYLSMYDDVSLPEPSTLFDDGSGRARPAREQEMTIERHFFPFDLKLTTPKNLTDEQRAVWDAAYAPKNEAMLAMGLTGDAMVRWRYQRYMKDYLRCIASVDDNLGRVLTWLKQTGHDKDTIVIYSSDQGFFLGDHGWYDKRWAYEESLRMPFIVRWPGVTAPGSENTDLAQNIDFAQTFLDMAGVDAPAEMQGESLVPLLKGQTPDDWRESIYYHYYEWPAVHMVHRHQAVRTDRHKLIRYYEIDEWEFFDMESDPDELTNAYADPQYAAIIEELKVELVRLQEHYDEDDPRRDPASVDLRQVLGMPGFESEIQGPVDPSRTPISIGGRITPAGANGVLFAHGGNTFGYSLYVKDGLPHFAVRNDGETFVAKGRKTIVPGETAHLTGVLDSGGILHLYVNGLRTASKRGSVLLARPGEGYAIGVDSDSPVAEYGGGEYPPAAVADVQLYWGALEAGAVRDWADAP